jgi:hypothetical protein
MRKGGALAAERDVLPGAATQDALPGAATKGEPEPFRKPPASQNFANTQLAGGSKHASRATSTREYLMEGGRTGLHQAVVAAGNQMQHPLAR